MWKYIVYTLVFLFIYRLLVNFILPVFKMARVAKDGMRRMQQQMEEMQQQQQTNQHIHNQSSHSRVKEGDYIDYEEVK